MDPRTLDAYATRAAEYVARDASVPSHLEPLLELAFPRTSGVAPRILDVGAGSGRELALLVARGYDAYGVEPVSALRDAARAQHPDLAGRVHDASLPGLAGHAFGLYAGILCSAVLQHVPRSRLFEAVLDLRDHLEPGGRLLVSIPSARADLDATGRDPHGRLFSGVTGDELTLLFEHAGLRRLLVREDEDSLGRPGTRWTTLLFERPVAV